MVHCTPIFGSFMFFLKWLLQIIKHWSSERTDRLTTRVFFGGVTLLNLSQQLGFLGCFLPFVGWGGWRDEGRQITSYCLHSSNVLLRCYAVSLVMELRPRSGRYALKFVIWLRPRSRCYVLNLVMPRRPRSWTYALNLKRLAGVGGNHKEPPKSCKYHWKTTWCDKQFYKVMLKTCVLKKTDKCKHQKSSEVITRPVITSTEKGEIEQWFGVINAILRNT